MNGSTSSRNDRAGTAGQFLAALLAAYAVVQIIFGLHGPALALHVMRRLLPAKLEALAFLYSLAWVLLLLFRFLQEGDWH